jgi:hypothetical protein
LLDEDSEAATLFVFFEFLYFYPCFILSSSWNSDQIRQIVQFDQGRLANLSTMLNLKSLWKYDRDNTIFSNQSIIV